MNFEYFRHVEHKPLRTWNQSVMYYNIIEDGGKEAGLEYANGLSQEEKQEVLTLIKDIKKRGVEIVRAELNRSMFLNKEGYE